MKSKATPQIRWSRDLEGLRALSIRQPWAWLIVHGYKDVENRSWATKHRGPLLIHAGSSKANLSDANRRQIEKEYRVKLPSEFELGGIVGIAEVADCKERSKSRWHSLGWIGWMLANPRRLSFRACKGALNLFKPKFEDA